MAKPNKSERQTNLPPSALADGMLWGVELALMQRYFGFNVGRRRLLLAVLRGQPRRS